ncbi:hypothetical protein N7447_006293 [Penicillium robsamsonii]|uniref:uncharacterized protein n=1 Tax=Penicillium robsamsonii TaxID=1792511 RepID=UPI0025494EB0|nr:uncharacterized protein N7447_006293 [Penicillium robsamsonii]KAJ5823953.1 hypothetical protein N7447_006293 [Penicillium robsamsonii]
MNMIDLIYVKCSPKYDCALKYVVNSLPLLTSICSSRKLLCSPLHENISRCNNSIAIDERQPYNLGQAQQISVRDVITTNEQRAP